MAAKHSTRMETADRLLDDLLPLAARSDTDVVRRAARVLSSWDRRANSLSRGAVLFAAWFGRLAGESAAFAIPWSPDRPLETPDGLSSPETALEVLAAVAHRVEQSFGSLDVEWGEIYRLRLDDADLPASGGPGRLGVFRSINFTPDRDGRMRAAAGDSFVAAVRFSDPIEARALTVYGNSSQPGSPHRTDQLPLFAGQKLRKVWFTREDVEAHTVERKVF